MALHETQRHEQTAILIYAIPPRKIAEKPSSAGRHGLKQRMEGIHSLLPLQSREGQGKNIVSFNLADNKFPFRTPTGAKRRLKDRYVLMAKKSAGSAPDPMPDSMPDSMQDSWQLAILEDSISSEIDACLVGVIAFRTSKTKNLPDTKAEKDNTNVPEPPSDTEQQNNALNISVQLDRCLAGIE